MMYDAINSFASQFDFKPIIENKRNLRSFKQFIVLGMGGSNLAPDLLKMREPALNILSHRDYGLPGIAPRDALYIASSYSGNTEETIDGFREALKRKLPVAAITTGGTLLALAKRSRVPYVLIPKTGIQPRSALGFSVLGLAALTGLSAHFRELRALSRRLKPAQLSPKGKALAKKISGRIPVIYSSVENAPIAYNWKIKFNETGKIPAFANSFPELNHNEMTGYDVTPSTKKLSRGLHFIFLRGGSPKITKRMEVTARLYRARGLPVEMFPFSGRTPYEKIFSSLILADWAAYWTGERYGVETEAVPMVEQFKRLIS